jgi:hypothetical protein
LKTELSLLQQSNSQILQKPSLHQGDLKKLKT